MYLQMDEFSHDLGEMLDPPLRPAILDRDRAILNPAEFTQSLHKRADPTVVEGRRVGAQEPDSRQFRWRLGARHQRPRRRPAKHRDERAPVHSMTSSARAMRAFGTSNPSALAVLRLITSSNFVGCCTGRSAGLAPFRMRSTYEADCLKTSLVSGP